MHDITTLEQRRARKRNAPVGIGLTLELINKNGRTWSTVSFSTEEANRLRDAAARADLPLPVWIQRSLLAATSRYQD